MRNIFDIEIETAINVIMKLPTFEVFVSLFMYVGALVYAIYHTFDYGKSEFISF